MADHDATENASAPQPKPPSKSPEYNRAKRRRRLNAGLCGMCGGPKDGGSLATCPACLAKMKARNALSRPHKPPKPPRETPPASADMAAYKRAWRAKRRAGESCTTCNGPRDTPGRVRCSACRAADKVTYEKTGRDNYRSRADAVNAAQAEEIRRWKAAGLCSGCGGVRDTPNRQRCTACKAVATRVNKVRYAKRRSAGLCPGCGNIPTSGAYCDRCNDIRREDHRDAYAADPIRFRLRCEKRRGRIVANGGTFTTDDWEDIRARQGYRCLCCGRAEPEIVLTVDHVIPVSKGGGSDPANLQGLCRECNASKGTASTDYRPTQP